MLRSDRKNTMGAEPERRSCLRAHRPDALAFGIALSPLRRTA